MPANVETMFYVGGTPWHQLGEKLTEAPDPIKAVKLAGLDWTVEKEPIFLEDGTEIPNRFAVIRSDNRFALGVVGKAFRPVQNLEAAEFARALQAEGGSGVEVETAGSLDLGRRVWFLTRLAEGVTVEGDAHVPYLLVANGHDGSLALRAATTMIRVVCQNTLTMAFMEARSAWSIRHTGGVTGRVTEAQRALGLAYAQVEKFEVEVAKLIDKTVTDQRFDRIVEKLLPAPKDGTDRQDKKVDVRRDQVRSRWETDPNTRTAWGAFNAFNGFELWDRPNGKDQGKRLERQAMFVLGRTGGADFARSALKMAAASR
jgi:phage/plasmid-like protein (TIGR03299 family)